MADDERQAAADRLDELEPVFDQLPRPKLPQARLYLRASRWGFDEMVGRHQIGTGFVFQIIGILTLLRAVPFALFSKDRKISAAHEVVIGEWWKCTDPATTPELLFIKRARDLALKEGALNTIAVASASRIGEGPKSIEVSRDYDVDFVDRGERHDLLAKLREIFDWFEAQLSEIEARLPAD